MKDIVLTLFLTVIGYSGFGQQATVSVEKENYKFDEIVEVTFEMNAKFDSIKLPDLEGFTVIGGPTTSSSVSITNGVTTVSKSHSYRLNPSRSGELVIPSPRYYIDGIEIVAESVTIVVAESNLTPEELEEKRFRDFVKYGIKPRGTSRILFYEDWGYVEVFGESGWEFQRRLTEEELEQLRGMK